MKRRYWWCELVRLVLASTFIISGLAKAIDPIGTISKVAEYLSRIGGFSGSLGEVLAPWGAILLIALEFLIGAFLLGGIYRKLCSRLAFALLAVMTALTGYIFFSGIDIDCGCFGDLIHLSPLATFAKNLILLPLAYLLIPRARKLRHLFSRRERWIPAVLAIIGIGYCIYESYFDLPAWDSLPYRVGYHLPTQINQADSLMSFSLAEQQRYVYSKEGVEQTFDLNALPDSSWSYVRTEETSSSPTGNYRLTYSFHPLDSLGQDLSEDILSNPRGVFLLCTPSLAKASQEAIDSYNELYRLAQSEGYTFYGITASPASEQNNWSYETGAEYPFLFLDATTIKTITRSTPGLILLKGGTIIDKVPSSRVPSANKLKPFIESRFIQNQHTQPLLYRWIALALWSLVHLAALVRRASRQTRVLLYLGSKTKQQNTSNI